jgi:hypothetical protein
MEPRSDRRRYPRKIQIWSGRLLVDGNAVDCAISNTTRYGLKLITETGIDLPDEAVVEYPDGTTRRCSVRWRCQNEAGVSLED